MIISNKNNSYQQSVECSDGGAFEECNFAQLLPHTAILTGKTGIKFTRCNLLNCDVPAGSVVEDCLTVHIDRCANLPQNADIGLPAEDANCRHVVATDTVSIDGVVVETIYQYENTVVQ